MPWKLFLVALASSSLGPSDAWPVGTEREVDEGIYMKAVSTNSGWRIWRVETKSDVECRAVKSAVGNVDSVPLGVGSTLYGGSPFLKIHWGDYAQKFVYSWGTRFTPISRLKYRVPEAKFWEETTYAEFDAEEIGERRIEIVVVSWEYPTIQVGLSEEKAIFDLAGLKWALSEIASCEAKTLNRK